MIVPVTVQISETTTEHLGLRPSRLPPLRASAIRISHIIPGSWADLIGLQVGDFITHVNGTAIADMMTPQEFLTSISARPCTISFLLQADQRDVMIASEIAARSRAATSTDSVNAMFDRLFGKPDVSAAQLFDSASFRSIKPPSDGEIDDLRTLRMKPPAKVAEKQMESDEEDEVVELSEVPIATKTDALKPPYVPISSQPVNNNQPISKTRVAARRAAPNPKSTLHVKTPVTVHLEIVQGVDVPRYSGMFASDPLWQPMTSEPFVEVCIKRISDSRVMTKKLQTKVDMECRWNHKFVLPVLFPWEKASEYVISVRLCDYRRFTDFVVMGDAEILVSDIALLDSSEPASIPLTLNAAANYFDVSNTKLIIKCFVPASLVPAQPADDQDLDAAQEAAETVTAVQPQRAVTAEEGVQTEELDEKPIFTWTKDEHADTDLYHGHIPWIYEKWHKALSLKTNMRMVK